MINFLRVLKTFFHRTRTGVVHLFCMRMSLIQMIRMTTIPQHKYVLVLVLTVVVYQGAHATILECSNPLPGVRKMIRGVDITELDLLPLDLTSNRGIRSPVLNFTCNGEREWRDQNGNSYQLPDQVWHSSSVPGGWLSSDVRLYKSSKDVRTTLNNQVGGGGSIWKFSFSASHSYVKMEHTIMNQSNYISDVSAFESATKVDMIPDWVLGLDRFTKMFVDNFLSGTFASNPTPYKRFIEQFGTHYFSSANFGGYIRVIHSIDKSYFYSNSETKAKTNAKASFLKVIEAHGGHTSESTTVDSSFTEKSTKTIKYYGGDTNLLTDSGIQQWQPSVDRDPWLFSGVLKPISNLITDDTKKASMVEAVKQHVLKSYVAGLQRLVNYAKPKFTTSTSLVSLENRLNSFQARDALIEADVTSLGNEVEHELLVPDWFKSRTELCYKWRPDGDGGQCGGGAPRLICAKPNSMTRYYRDDTDRRSGGCRMQWGIRSTGFESWFSSVRVCYRWYPDGDGGQCGGGAARELCASLNNFSPEYRDDTDRRSGGCQMSWRLVVPANAPFWMKNSQLCFRWYPDGNGGQCWAESRELCAKADSWTKYYRDDTDRRSGGCQMSWGIKVVT